GTFLSAMAMNERKVPPCANVRRDDVEFPSLNLSMGEAKSAEISATLNTSLGFGGANTCVILGPSTALPLPPGEGGGEGVSTRRNAPFASFASPHPKPLPEGEGRKRDVLVTGIGVVFPGIIGNDALLARLLDTNTRITHDTGAIPESD